MHADRDKSFELEYNVSIMGPLNNSRPSYENYGMHAEINLGKSSMCFLHLCRP